MIALAFVVTACGPAATKPEPAAGDGGTTDTSAPARATPAANPSTGIAAVDQLIKKRRASTFKVTYTWTASDGSAPLAETWYQKPPKSRVDFGEPGAKSLTSQFVLADGHYVCETSDGKSTCFKGGAAAGTVPEELSPSATVMVTFEGLLADPSVSGVQRSTRTIAGQQGSCAKSGSVLVLALAEATLCHASNGVPLFFEFKSASGSLTMTAVTFTTNVPDADFDLPAKP